MQCRGKLFDIDMDLVHLSDAKCVGPVVLVLFASKYSVMLTRQFTLSSIRLTFIETCCDVTHTTKICCGCGDFVTM